MDRDTLPGDPPEGNRDGERRKAAGVRRAIENRPGDVLRVQIALLKAVRRLGRATIDDASTADELVGKFLHKGVRGAGVSGLRCRGLIRVATEGPPRVRSVRRFRHHGENRAWEATAPADLNALIADRERQLADLRRTGGAR